MLDNVSLKQIIFFDIETVPQHAHFDDLDDELRQLWQYRIYHYKPNETPDENYFWEKASVYAEFGKIVCISVGYFAQHTDGGDEYVFRVKSFAQHDERQLLIDFLKLMERYRRRERSNEAYYLCGHHIKEFDIPFICRRALILGLSLPPMLDVAGLKPWEIHHLDTMHLWRFGDLRNYTSLHLLTRVLGIPNPKSDMEGSDVSKVYWHDRNIKRIANYCQQDVVATARVIQHFKQMPLLQDEQIVYVP